jgi:L-lactate dehydrogenase complex protein LldG
MSTNDANRRAVFERVRGALAGKGDDATRRAAVAARLASPPVHKKPSRVEKTGEDRIAQFRAYLEGQSAIVHEARAKSEIPKLISAYLRSQNAPLRVRHGADSLFAELPWNTEPTLEHRTGRAAPEDEVGLSHATAGISETGTLVLMSGADNPVTVSFMPETHIVVVDASSITGSYEEAWAALRKKRGADGLTRTVNFISGPSRTGDIGGRIVMGAHGPKKMCVIILRD